MRRLLLLFLLLLCSWLKMGVVQAQTTIAQESFESANAPASSASSYGYSSFSSNTFDLRPNSTTEYFVRSQQPVTGFYNGTTGPQLTGIDGAWLWACEGVRGTGGVSSTSNPPTRPAGYVQLNSISIAGKSNVQIKVLFANSRGPGSGTTTGGAPYLWETDDFVRVKVRVDGGNWTTIGQFTGDNSNPNNNTQGVLRLDANLNNSSVDDAALPTPSPSITATFQDFTFNVAGTGSTMDVMVEADYAGASEELAFDDIRVLATQATTAAPVLANIEGTSLNYNEGDPATQITGTLTVADTDSPNLTGGSVRITTGLVPAQDRLLFTNQNGITGSYNTSTGILTLTGTATVAAYQAALRSVQYQNSQTVTAIGGLRLVSFSLTDGATASNTVSRNVIVNAQLNSPAALPYVEDFETDGEGLRYASDTWLNSGSCLGFLRTNQNPYPCTPVTIGNISNSYYWYSEGTSNPANPNPVDIGTLTLAPVNATGYANLRFGIRMATGQSAQWENDDFVKFYYRVNGGAWVLFSAFYGNGTLAAPGELQRDTDLDGVADGGAGSLTLNSTMQTADLALPATVTGASVDFQILINSDGQEEFMFDRINITGTQVTTVNSIVRASANPTNATTVNYTVSFGAQVTGLMASNFSLTTTGTVSGVSVGTPVAGSGNTWTVPVSTGSGSGTITLNLANSSGLSSSISTTLPFTGETYTIDKTAPAAPVVVTSANGSFVASATPTYTGTAEASSTVTVIVDGSSIGTTTANSAGTWSLTQPTTLAQGSHTVRATATDALDNVSPSSNTNTFTVDSVRPSVTISSSAGGNGNTTGTTPIPFTITFSESVANFVAGDVTVTGGTISGFSGSGTTYTFNVTPTSSGNTVTVNVAANTAQDAAGNGNTAASPFSITARPNIVLSPTTLPSGTVGVAYSQAIIASGGIAPYSYAITAGALPAGLTLSSAGVISGTPTGGTSTFTVTATDASAAPGPYSGAGGYTVTIAAPTITLAPASLPNGTQGTAYSVTFSASGSTGPYAYAITAGSVPPGMSLSSGGTLSGTPSASGSYTFTVTARDNSTAPGPYSGARTYTVNITPRVTVTAVTRLTPSPAATATVSYRVLFSGSVSGLTVSNFDLTTTGLSSAAVTSVSGSGATYTVVVNTGSGDGTLRLNVNNATGVSPTVGNVPYTSGELYTITRSFAAAPTLRIQGAGSASGNSDVTAYVDLVQVLQSGTSTVVANGLQNGSFETNNVQASNYLYQSQGVSATPWTFGPQAGVSRNNSAFGSTAADGNAVAFLQSAAGNNGNVSQNLAVPTGSYQIQFRAAQRFYTSLDQRLNVFINDVFVGNILPNDNSTYDTFTSASFNVTAPALTATVSTPSSSPTSNSPIPFSVSFSQSVGSTFTASDVTVSGGTLASGSFSGSGAGPYTFTVIPAGVGTVAVSLGANVALDANNTGNSASNTVIVQFQAPTITLAPASLPNGTQGTAYSVTFSASGGTSPYAYAITAGTLPVGLALASNGTLSGTPAASGSYTFTLTATDNSSAPGPYSGSRSYTLTINPQPVTAAPVVTAPANGALVNTATPTYTGAAPANSTVTVYVDATSIGTTTATGGGTWSLAQPTALGQGNHQVYAIAQTRGSTVSANSNTNTFTVDTVAPAVVLSSSTVVNNGLTSTSPVLFTATFSEPVMGLTSAGISVSGGRVSSGPTAGSGNTYTFQVTPNGLGTVSVQVLTNAVQDQAGNNNAISSTYSFNFQAPTITLAPASLPNGTQGTAYSVTFSASGGTSPYAYAITAGTLPVGLALASNGTLSGTPAASGSYTFTLTATDNSSAPGPYSGSRSYTLTINPQPVTAAPVVTAPANGALVNTATPTYTGAAPANSTVTVYVDATSIGTTTATGGGTWSLTQPTTLTQGNHKVRATAQRSGQAVSSNSNENSFTVDTVAPTVVINSSAGASGSTTGITPIPFAVTFSEPVTGFVAADLTVSGGSIANFAGSGTSYTFDVTPAADGLITVEVPANVAQDGVNNGNTASSVFSITYSRPVTATPVVVTPANGSVTTSTKPTYTGTATALASLTLVVDENTATSQTTTVDASGNWTLTQLTDLAPGAHTVQARAQLAGQTVSAYSAVNSFTVVVLSSVVTATPTGVTSSGATLGGEVTDAGAGTVSERGVVYVAGNGTPTTSDTKVSIGAGTGNFAQAVTNLSPSTNYSVRAYAINQAGTSYGATQVVATGNSLAITSVTPSTVCAGATINVAYTNSSPGTPLTVYLNGPSTTNLPLTTLNASQTSGTITATIPADRIAGQYSVYLGGGGVSSGNVNVTVNAIPPAPTVVSSIIYCQNVVASPLSATGQGLTWYTTSTGGTGSTTAPTPPTSTVGSTNYYVSQTINGCESPRATLTVTVIPLPQVPSTTPVTVCQNATPISLATGVTASQGASLNWYTAATGGTAFANAPVPPTSAVGTTTYYVSQVINGCESGRAALIYTVNPLPGVTLTNDGPLSCTKPAVTLTAGGNGSAYRFSSGATPIGTGNQATVSLSGTYSVTLIDGNGCSATAQTEVGSDQSNPQAGLTNDGPLTCAKTTVTLTAAGNGSYRFSPGATQNGSTNLATVTTGGVYSVTVTAPNGCSATAQTTVEVNTTVAAPTLTTSALSTENAPISVTASGCSGTISWTATGGTGTANGSVYTVTQPGNYALTATCTVGTCTSPAAPSMTLQIRPGGFAISGVELVRCQLLDAGRGQYEISFTPQYSGLSGSPVSFSVTNELAATTAPGPYTLRLYTDNTTIGLVASQNQAQASYRYNWLAACSGSQPAPNRPPVAQPIPDQVLVAGQNYQLDLSSYFSDPDGQSLTFTTTGLPAGLQLSGNRISGSPTQTGTTTVQLTALDPGGLQAVGSVLLRVDPAPVTPTPGVFSIAGVTGVRCETLSVGERQLSFSPVYTGLTGAPVSFGITNELAITTAPGPYSLRLYTDNPAITLTATQNGTQASYRFSWLAACPTGSTTPPAGNRPPVVGTGLGNQTATAGQGYTLFIPAGTFTDPDNDQLQLTVSGLPAGLSFSVAQNAITGTPAQAGSSTVQVTATDPGNLSASLSFVLTVQPAATTPTPSVFSIAGVTGVRCETLSVGERQLSFSPVYTGLTGQKISFGIINELATTTAPGPYSLRLYTDNPTITLTATQGSSSVSYRYNWLAACATNPNGRQAMAEVGSQLSVVVLGNPVVGESAEVLIGGAAGQAVALSLTDLAGNRLYQQSIPQAATEERVTVPVSAGQAITILKVSTATQQQTVKLIRH